MWIKRAVVLSLLTIAPAIASANLYLQNNTDYYGTAKTSWSPCSSIAGDKGIAKPHQSMSVEQSVVDTFCGLFGCEVFLYMSQNCSGAPVGVAQVSARKGITSIKNSSNRVVISGGGKSAYINPR